jgi:hypothetical protein
MLVIVDIVDNVARRFIVQEFTHVGSTHYRNCMLSGIPHILLAAGRVTHTHTSLAWLTPLLIVVEGTWTTKAMKPTPPAQISFQGELFARDLTSKHLVYQ